MWTKFNLVEQKPGLGSFYIIQPCNTLGQWGYSKAPKACMEQTCSKCNLQGVCHLNTTQ